MNPEDHDLLIRVDENVKELKRLVVEQIGDHEARIRVIEHDRDETKGQIEGISKTLKVLYAILSLFGAGAVAMFVDIVRAK